MSERVVVIIPAYNEEEYIAPTVRSLAAQRASLPNDVSLHVILADRPGRDDTRGIAAGEAKRLGLELHIVDDTEHSMSGARRCAVQHAREHLDPTLFLSMDADTSLPDRWLGEAIRVLREGGFAMVGGEGFFATEFWRSVPALAALYAENVGAVFLPRQVYDLHRSGEGLFDGVFDRFGRPPSDCAMLVTSEALAATGDIPLDVDEVGEVEQGVGWPLMVRLIDRGLKLTSLPHPKYETSARRLISDASALLDSTTYRDHVVAYRDDSQKLRAALDEYASGLNWRELRDYVIRNYVLLACLLRPALVRGNVDLFGEETAADLENAIRAERDRDSHRRPDEAFRAARRLVPVFRDRILLAFEKELAE